MGPALALAGLGGWAVATTQTHVVLAGVTLGGFAIGFLPRHRALRASALRHEVRRLESELTAEVRVAAAAERAAIATELESLVAVVTCRSSPSASLGADPEAAARALREAGRAARDASAEVRGLLAVLDEGAERDGAPQPLLVRARALRARVAARLPGMLWRHGPVVVFAAVGVVDQLLVPARPAEVAPGVIVPAAPYPVLVAAALGALTALPLVVRGRAPLLAVGTVGALLVARSAVGDLSSLTWSQNAVGVGLAFAAGAYAAPRLRLARRPGAGGPLPPRPRGRSSRSPSRRSSGPTSPPCSSGPGRRAGGCGPICSRRLAGRARWRRCARAGARSPGRPPGSSAPASPATSTTWSATGCRS
jgi:hypothetical protein